MHLYSYLPRKLEAGFGRQLQQHSLREGKGREGGGKLFAMGCLPTAIFLISAF
jgi:hypothetical protein